MDTAPAPRNYWNVQTLSAPAADALLDCATRLKHMGGARPLRGKNIAVLSEDQQGPSARLVAAAALSLGARVSWVRPGALRIADAEQIAETCRVLGLFYDAIACDGIAPARMDALAAGTAMPVFNELADRAHPVHLLSELMTMREHMAADGASLTAVCLEPDLPPRLVSAWKKFAALIGLVLRRGAAQRGDFLVGSSGLSCGDARSDAELRDAEARNQDYMVQALLATHCA